MRCSSRSFTSGLSKTSVRCPEVCCKPHGLSRFPLQIHFWQQILRYHHRTIALDNMRLIKLATVDGFALDRTAVKDSWQHYLGGFLRGHLGHCICHRKG